MCNQLIKLVQKYVRPVNQVCINLRELSLLHWGKQQYCNTESQSKQVRSLSIRKGYVAAVQGILGDLQHN